MKQDKALNKLRRACFRKGIITICIARQWVLFKFIPEQNHIATSHNLTWEYELPSRVKMYTAFHTKQLVAKRMKGSGRGIRPYPRTNLNVTAYFKTEREALQTVLMLPEKFKWY